MGEKCEIAEVFHSAVEETEGGECFQLFGDDGFSWICAEQRRREIQQSGVLNLSRTRSTHVAEAGVELASECGLWRGLRGIELGPLHSQRLP